jgi:hypothetical protein
MKALLIIALGCIPLAVLTVASFVDLAAGLVAAQATADGSASPQTLLDRAAADAQASKPPLAALQKADLLAPVGLPELSDSGSAAAFKDLAAAWPKWTSARAMALEGLAALRDPGADREQVRLAIDRLEKIKAAQPTVSLPESAAMVALVDQRITALKGKSTQLSTQADGDKLLQTARDAFAPGKYGQCVETCNTLLAKFGSAFDADKLAKVRLLQRRAQFNDDAEKLADKLPDALTPQEQRALLSPMVERYANAEALSAAQQAYLERLRGQLHGITDKLQAATWGQEGTAQIDHYLGNLPQQLGARLKGAAAIAEKYPAPAIRVRLGEEVRRWLGEFVPEKRLEEPLQLREVRTKQGPLVRGFFKSVPNAAGGVSGYQCYPTQEQLLNPRSAVSTYSKELLAGEPEESLPRRVVNRYNQARVQAVAKAGDRAGWTQLAALCRQLEQELSAYRAQPGSSTEPLSFTAEEQVIGQLLQEPQWSPLQKIVGK